MAREFRAVELEAKVVVMWVALRLRQTGTIDEGGGGDSTCGGVQHVLLLGRERMVSVVRAVEWGQRWSGRGRRPKHCPWIP
jgi:hypothetical protein